ncbi:MAG: FKBP-type peptidyl-prolyl cis-trans isomerase N-terminal domain-containing protein, partial [Bacteroidales bacterium]|nr:FKBP-type peptidyl-prolyl cis-trans isomerase N-terminal domain-containing protein [Bacteroidales bacterium]
MKAIKIFAVAAVVIAAVSCSSGKPVGVAKDLDPTKGEIDSISYLVGLNFGSFIKGYNLGDLNYSEIKKGIDDFLNAKGNQRDSNYVKQFKISPEVMNDAMRTFIEKRAAYTSAVNKAEQDKYFEEVKKIEGIQTTDSGLCYI